MGDTQLLRTTGHERHRRATNETPWVRRLLMAGALAFMLSISPKLTVYAFLPLPIVSITVQYFGRQIHERFEPGAVLQPPHKRLPNEDLDLCSIFVQQRRRFERALAAPY